jgi:hypothetical protein
MYRKRRKYGQHADDRKPYLIRMRRNQIDHREPELRAPTRLSPSGGVRSISPTASRMPPPKMPAGYGAALVHPHEIRHKKH